MQIEIKNGECMLELTLKKGKYSANIDNNCTINFELPADLKNNENEQKRFLFLIGILFGRHCMTNNIQLKEINGILTIEEI